MGDEPRQEECHGVIDDAGIRTIVIVGEHVAHADDLAPWNLGMALLVFGRDAPCCLADDFRGAGNGELSPQVRPERLSPDAFGEACRD